MIMITTTIITIIDQIKKRLDLYLWETQRGFLIAILKLQECTKMF